MVEFALVLPILLLVLFGITEFGRAWMTVNILTSAAREGARLAIVTAPDENAVITKVNSVCALAGVTPSSVTVTGPDPADPSRSVTVAVTTQFTMIPGVGIMDYFDKGLLGSFELRATSVMRHEAL